MHIIHCQTPLYVISKYLLKLKEFSYEDDEIDKLLNYLDEFNTVVKRVKVTAYSSIEGNVKENEMLQSKRAETVVDALKGDRKRV